jgi:hypothetical protein
VANIEGRDMRREERREKERRKKNMGIYTPEAQ